MKLWFLCGTAAAVIGLLASANWPKPLAENLDVQGKFRSRDERDLMSKYHLREIKVMCKSDTPAGGRILVRYDFKYGQREIALRGGCDPKKAESLIRISRNFINWNEIFIETNEAYTYEVVRTYFDLVIADIELNNKLHVPIVPARKDIW